MLCLKLYALPKSLKSNRFQPKSYVTRTTKSLFDNLNIVILELPSCPTFHHFYNLATVQQLVFAMTRSPA